MAFLPCGLSPLLAWFPHSTVVSGYWAFSVANNIERVEAEAIGSVKAFTQKPHSFPLSLLQVKASSKASLIQGKGKTSPLMGEKASVYTEERKGWSPSEENIRVDAFKYLKDGHSSIFA